MVRSRDRNITFFQKYVIVERNKKIRILASKDSVGNTLTMHEDFEAHINNFFCTLHSSEKIPAQNRVILHASTISLAHRLLKMKSGKVFLL